MAHICITEQNEKGSWSEVLTSRHRPSAPTFVHNSATCINCTESNIIDDTHVNATVKMVFSIRCFAAPFGFSFHLVLFKDKTQDEHNGNETLELFAFHDDVWILQGAERNNSYRCLNDEWLKKLEGLSLAPIYRCRELKLVALYPKQTFWYRP